MSHRTASLGAIAAAAMLLALPAAASAVTGSVAKPCYSHIPTKGTEPIVVTLTGGTPLAGYVLAATVPNKGLGSAGSASGDFDAAGNATVQITNVFPPSGSIDPIRGEPVLLSVKDFGAPTGPVDVPIGQTLITNLSLDIAGQPRSPRARRRIRVSGTPFAGRPMYGFVVHGSGSRVLRRVSLGTGDGCGYTSSKGIVAPRSFKRGSYRFYVNAGNTLNKDLAIAISFKISRSLF